MIVFGLILLLVGVVAIVSGMNGNIGVGAIGGCLTMFALFILLAGCIVHVATKDDCSDGIMYEGTCYR